MTVNYLRATTVAVAAAALTSALTLAALAANPKDVARAKDTRGIPNCTKCDLTGAKMTEGFFQLANLIDSDLSGANFDRANMAGTQLNNVKAVKASFVYTNFSGARLDKGDFSGANFSNAWLNWTWFAGAKFDGANFTGAKMPGAQLYNADLSKAIGLTQDQIDKACGDYSTKLPPGIKVPACVTF